MKNSYQLNKFYPTYNKTDLNQINEHPNFIPLKNDAVCVYLFEFKCMNSTMSRNFIFLLMMVLSNRLMAQVDDYSIDTAHPMLGQVLVLRGFPFDLDRPTLRADGLARLDSLTRFLSPLKGVGLQLEVHTDCRGSFEYNQMASQRKADTLVENLNRLSMYSIDIVAVGKGESEWINNCSCDEDNSESKDCSEIEHQANNRVVIRIITIKEND